MNNSYLAKAKLIIPDPQILSIVASKRARQLALGARPMVKCSAENHLDVALLEIAEQLLSYEFLSPEDAVVAPAETEEVEVEASAEESTSEELENPFADEDEE